MSIDIYEGTDTDVEIEIDDDLDFGSGIAGFEIAYGSGNKKAIRKAAQNKYHIKQKLDSINEKRSLDRQLNSFSHYWEM